MEKECLFKYLDIEGALSMIRHGELQFTNPFYFNDPFDCHPGLFEYPVPERYSTNPMVGDFKRDKAISDSDNNRKRVWICSLSKRKDSILMWSYYTNHRGVCVGLNRGALSSHLNKSSLGMMTLLDQDVEYKDILAKPNGVVEMGPPLLYQFLSKSEQWKHEDEVRHIIIDPHPWIPYRLARETAQDEQISWQEVRFYPQLSAECFDSIYLGARISDSDKLRVLRAIQASIPDVKVFQLDPDIETFSFVERPVDVEQFLSTHKESE